MVGVAYDTQPARNWSENFAWYCEFSNSSCSFLSRHTATVLMMKTGIAKMNCAVAHISWKPVRSFGVSYGSGSKMTIHFNNAHYFTRSVFEINDRILKRTVPASGEVDGRVVGFRCASHVLLWEVVGSQGNSHSLPFQVAFDVTRRFLCFCIEILRHLKFC